MPNRIFGANGYRYAYQGQEKDPETGKEAFQLRLWDGRIGKWLTVDPAKQYSSPYLGMGNNPVSRYDPDGGCDQPDSKCGFFKRAWYNLTRRNYLVKRWDAVNDTYSLDKGYFWEIFAHDKENKATYTLGVNLKDASIVSYTTKQSELSAESLLDLIPLPGGLDYMPVPIFNPDFNSSIEVQMAGFAPKIKPKAWVNRRIWRKTASIRGDIIKAMSRTLSPGSKGQSGIKPLTGGGGKTINGVTYKWEIKLTGQNGVHRIYGNKVKYNGKDIYYFDYWDKGKKK